MTAYRVIDDHKELDNVGSLTHDQIDTHVSGTSFIVVSGTVPPSGRLLTAGGGITIVDGGPGASIVISASGSGGGSPGGSNTQVQFNDSGSFGGDPSFVFDKLSNSLSVTNLSGSLTHLADGTSYLIAGSGVNISSGTNGSITISAVTSGTITEVSAGLGLSGGGFSGSVALAIDDSVVATVSGATFVGPVFFNTGLSGSLTTLADGSSYLVAGNNIVIASSSNGAVTISSTASGSSTPGGANTQVQFNDSGSFGGVSSFFFEKTTNTLSVVNLTGSLTRLSDGSSYLVAGSGISIASSSNGAVTISSFTTGTITAVSAGIGLLGGGTSGSVSLAIDNSVVATVSGTTFTGPVKFNSGLSGSLTRLTDGSSYLRAGANVSIFTSSNGSVTITAAAGTGAPQGPDGSVQFNDGGFFNGESTFTYDKSTDSLTVVNLSGSLTKLSDGSSYLVAGPNISISSASNGSVVISSTNIAASTLTAWMETPTGDADGVNMVFTLANFPYPASSMWFYVNGVRQIQGPTFDYTVTGDEITMNYSPTSGSNLFATYTYIDTNVYGTYTNWLDFVTGSADGTNTSFTLSNAPNPVNTLMLYVNGILQRQGASYDYSIAGNSISMSYPPNSGSSLVASYTYVIAPPAGTTTAWMEIPSGSVDGINTSFSVLNPPSPNSALMFFVNGVLQNQGSLNDYTLSGSTVTMNYTPASGSNILATYPY